MKNKNSLYILIPAVLVIWVLIIVRIKEGLSSDEGISLNKYTMPGVQAIELHSRDTLSYQLNLEYRDPFLDKFSSIRKIAHAKGLVPSSAPTTPEPVTVRAKESKEEDELKDMRFVGLLKADDQNKVVFILEYKGFSNLYKIGDTIVGFKITKHKTDSLFLSNGKKEVIIYKP